MEYAAAWRLAEEIKRSEEYRTYHSLKDAVMADETQAALIREYRKMQMEIQMRAVSGQGTPQEELQRFSTLGGLLYSKPEVSQFLLSEMRLQQALADIFKIITDTAGLDIQLPG
ncbi:MAG: YlbF family regulator [Clostridia bacterium]|nr:YlbF family regulator [Clostridia bacterium]